MLLAFLSSPIFRLKDLIWMRHIRENLPLSLNILRVNTRSIQVVQKKDNIAMTSHLLSHHLILVAISRKHVTVHHWYDLADAVSKLLRQVTVHQCLCLEMFQEPNPPRWIDALPAIEPLRAELKISKEVVRLLVVELKLEGAFAFMKAVFSSDGGDARAHWIEDTDAVAVQRGVELLVADGETAGEG